MADFSDVGIYDDPTRNPSTLRFGVGNLVMYKSETGNGWFEGEVVKVSQRLALGPQSRYIAYIVWPHREMSDEELGTEWVFEDTDEYIKPRMEDRTPDPSKVKPLLVSPDDQFHYVYTDFTVDGKMDDGGSMAAALEGLDIVQDAKTNPDGSTTIHGKDERETTMMWQEFPQESVHGIEPIVAVMFSSKYLYTRRPMKDDSTKTRDMLGMFKSMLPAESLAELERKAKTSPRKKLQLADCLMAGAEGFPKDANRACNLYRAAAWGCTEEEEPDRTGIPNGDPEAMIAAALIGVSFLERSLGYDLLQNVKVREWLEEGLKSETGIDCLHQIFYWTTYALELHGYVTPFTLMLGETVQEMNFGSSPLLARSDLGETIKNMCHSLIRTWEYREREMSFEKMQQKGEIPRGDPSDRVLEMFRPKALEILLDLPLASDAMHIEFKQVPRSPFPVVVVAFYPTMKKVQKIVRLPESLQTTPFSMESFQYVWLRIAFDIHLGRLPSNERVRPPKFTVPNTHGNKEFATFLEDALKDTNTAIQLVSHTDFVKTGKRTRLALGELVSVVMEKIVDVPGVLVDTDRDSTYDVVARAQEAFVDHLVAQQMSGIENEEDSTHLREAADGKARGNQYFQANDFNAAVRCYSIALGHMRRIVKHDQESHKLLGTLLSNRAACYLSLVERQLSLEFRKVLAQNAINDCTSALESSWSAISLPNSILEKLRFRRDKATASYDSLSAEYDSVADILFPDSAGAANANGSNETPTNIVPTSAGHSEPGKEGSVDANDAVIEYGEVLYENGLAKNAKEGCPICLRSYDVELSKAYSVVLPCGEHALCANCICSLKIEADKAKQCPQCPLCRYAFDPEFVEGIPSQIIEKDQEIANLILKLPSMLTDEKIAVAERLMWTNRFEVPAVVDAIESLLDGEASGLLFRATGDLTHQQKVDIYYKSRLPVEKLEKELNSLLQEQRVAVDAKALEKVCNNLRRVRFELIAAREKARDEIYRRMNTAGTMGAEQERGSGSLIQVDYHGLHVNEMRMKFKEHVLPILPVVGKVMIITGRGAHSAGKESKLKKALFKLIGQYEKDVYWQKVDKNPGALYVLWRKGKK